MRPAHTRSRFTRRAAIFALITSTALLGTACGPPSSTESNTGSSSGAAADAKTAASAEDLGGMEALVAAAEKEGALNVIALPPDWANYGEIIKAFQAKYPKVKITSAQPDASSAEEITAAKNLKGQSSAPDVFDLSGTVAAANTATFAKYKVATWDTIPDNLKDADGTWVNDYGGYMSIGYDAAKVPAITSVADLKKPEFKGKIALNGDPTQAGAAFAGVQMVAVAEGGSVDDVTKGVDFFKTLKGSGNFLPLDPTPATIESGQTPVVFDWDYLNASQAGKLKGKLEWKTFVPENAVVGGYYVQAINADAPHPAAARLWQEFLYSDEGQNLWLKGGARPVRMDAMTEAGTVDKTAAAALPKVSGSAIIPTEEQSNKAKEQLTASWANAVG